jgi:hypothetical protein
MPKSPSPFTGIKLTEQTPLAEDRIDQRLFSSSPSSPTVAAPTKGIQQSKKPWNLGNLEPRKQGSLVPRKLASKETRNLGTLAKAEPLAGEFDLNIAPYKNDTFAFTTEELNAIEDLKIELKRRLDLPATKNDIVRCAIHSIVEDYRQRGTESLLVQRIRKKKPR